ncbi:4'-phosphopantetheinyl transferase family protein [Bradyrhizobium australafricanum]|uniref:4'-phosphopantetheinyl transferase family protein n=1 Tax=Bradyrhizobium australafricanum TaxID=2821406 RepID=UPI001CE30732|nr:4'-phosphopantetheinyl transferase superfamily protein [Bradyrhizobium australafricanum]MCA6104055.1 4'-phosphopantetheinyl transferase superfamily protein [Bradyrhizobium australafricanum]
MNSQDAASDEFGAQTPADTCAELLGKLFPRPVGVAATSFNGANYPLFPSEENAVAGAVEKRRREFAAGRYCARRALSQLGFPTVAIPSAPDRSPVWPAGALGSVSHDSSLCVAVAARRTAFRSIGVDIEVIGAVGPELADVILRADERHHLEGWRPGDTDWLTLHFCLKEAAYKAFYPLCGQIIDFQKMHLSLAPADGHFRAFVTVPDPLSFEGRYAVCGSRIIAAAW